MLPIEDSICLAELAAGTNSWYNVTDSVRDALEILVKHASSQSRRIRHLEEALTRTEAVSARSQDKLDSRMDKVQEEMESVRACAVDTNIQSDDLRHRVQQLELRLCGTTMDPVLSSGSAEMGVSGRRSALGHNRPQLGLAVLDRLDQLDRDFEGVSRVANKTKDEFEATNACVYEMEKRLEERFVVVKTDVSLATAECRQQTVSEAVRTGRLQLDNLQERLTCRIQGVEQQQQSELASAAQQSEARLSEVESELSSRVKALSHLLDHTAKAGSQVMSHLAQLEATSKSDISGLDEAVARLSEQKVDASGMDSYTQEISKLFEESARQVRKEAIQHADQVNKALRQQVEAGLDKKADVSMVSREGQSSRQQLTDLWAEAEAARAGLDQVKGGLEQVQGRVEGLQDKVAITKEKVREVEHSMSQADAAAATTSASLDAETSRRRELAQQVQHLAGGVAVIKETLYGPTHRPPLPHSPSRSRSPSPTRVAGDSGALLASHGTLVGRLAAVSEQVEGLQSSLQQKADKSSLQEVKQQVREVRQQGDSTSQSLADLHSSVRQQGQEHTTGLHRLEALIATVSQERATTSEVRVWLDEATLEARTHTSDRVSHVAAALQRLNDAVEEDRAQAALVAGDYTPHQLQRMVERSTEGLLAVQRQVAAVQVSAEQGLTQTSSELRQRLEELHQKQQRHQDLVQVTGEHLKQVVHEVRGRITPEGAQALVTRELRDRDQADSDRWQGLVQRFTSAFEETKRELEGVTNDLEHSFSLQLATKLNSEELPQKLQEASLVSRASLQAHVKQVEASCQRLCQSLGAEVHRLALQVQVLEESDTLAIEAEADLNHLRKAISKKADRETVEADLERVHKGSQGTALQSQCACHVRGPVPEAGHSLFLDRQHISPL
ncbi:hypothetical protein WJX77_011846 [Trebouxia sp. C0004]